jgi:hypothetical protein
LGHRKRRLQIYLQRCQQQLSRQPFHHLRQGVDWVHRDVLDYRRLGGIVAWQEQALHPCGFSRYGDGKGTLIGFTLPSRESSPRITEVWSASAGSTPVALRRRTAIGRP